MKSNKVSFAVLVFSFALHVLPGLGADSTDGSSGLADGLALSARLGTLGAGVEASLGSAGPFVLRAGGNYLPLSFNGEINDVEYKLEPRLASASLLVELHPFKNSFHICGGMFYNRNKFRLDAKLSESQTIGDHKYTPDEIGKLSGKAVFRKWAPYLGIGFSNVFDSPDRGWGFVFDAGLMFQGSPDVSLSADGYLAEYPPFQQDLAKEEADIQKEADKYRFYPVISAGVSYTF